MEQTWSWLQMGSSPDYRTHQQNGRIAISRSNAALTGQSRNRTGRHLEVAR